MSVCIPCSFPQHATEITSPPSLSTIIMAITRSARRHLSMPVEKETLPSLVEPPSRGSRSVRRLHGTVQDAYLTSPSGPSRGASVRYRHHGTVQTGTLSMRLGGIAAD